MTFRISRIRMRAFKGQNRETEIAPRTVITGPNGSGKTAHLEAVATSILGCVPKIGKRSMPTLMSGAVMSAGIDLIDEADGGRELSITRTFKPAESVDMEPPVRGSLRDRNAAIAARLGECAAMIDLEEFIGLTPAKRATFLAGLLSGHEADVSVDDLLELLSAAGTVPEDVAKSIRGAWFDGDPIDVRLEAAAAVLADAESRARTAADAATGAVRTLDDAAEEMTGGESARVPELESERDRIAADLETIASELASSGERKTALERADALVTRESERLAKARDQRDAHSKTVQALREEVDSLPKAPEEMAEAAAELDDAYRAAVEREAETRAALGRLKADRTDNDSTTDGFGDARACPVAGIECPASDAVQAALIDQRTALDGLIKVAESDHDEAETDLVTARDALREYGERKTQAETAKRRREVLEHGEAELKAATDAVADYEDALFSAQKARDEIPGLIDTTDLEAQRESLRTRQGEIADALKAAAGAKSLRDSKIRSEAEAAEAKERATAMRSLQSAFKRCAADIMARAFAPITATVAELLNAVRPGMALELAAEDKGIHVYVRRHEGGPRVRWSVLSGGEKAIAGAALALALVKVQNPPAKFLLLEAAEVDHENLSALLDALDVMGGDFATIIVASWHAENVPDGWTVVDLAGGGE